MNPYFLANNISKIEDMTINEQNLICQLETNHIFKYSITCNKKTSKKKEFDINKLISKERTKFQPPSLETVIRHFQKKGYSAEMAERCYKYQHDRDWERNDGKKIKSWKGAIATWIKNEKNGWGKKPPVNEKNIKDILSNL